MANNLIPGTENLTAAYSQLTKFDRIVSDTVNIEGTLISGLIDPTTSSNSVTKNYVNNIFKINYRFIVYFMYVLIFYWFNLKLNIVYV